MSKHICPITTLFKKGVTFSSTPAWEAIVHELLAELSVPPVLVFPYWDAVEHASRPFSGVLQHLGRRSPTPRANRCLRQPRPPRLEETLDSARLQSRQHCMCHQAPSRLPFEARSSALVSDHKALNNIGKNWGQVARVQRWLDLLTAVNYILYSSTTGTVLLVTLISSPACHNPPLGTTARGLANSPPCMMGPYTSSVSAACATFTSWLGWAGTYPGPRAMPWAGSYHSPLLVFVIFVSLRTRAKSEGWRPFCSYGEHTRSCFLFSSLLVIAIPAARPFVLPPPPPPPAL